MMKSHPVTPMLSMPISEKKKNDDLYDDVISSVDYPLK